MSQQNAKADCFRDTNDTYLTVCQCFSAQYKSNANAMCIRDSNDTYLM